jgi:hypothetical protein
MSVPCKHANLATCLWQLSLSLFMWSTSRQGPWDMWQHQSSPLRKAKPGAKGHMIAPKLPSQEDRARSHVTRGSTRANLVRGVRTGARGHVVASELPSQKDRARSHGTHSSTGAHLIKVVRTEAERHVTVPELTSVRR